MSALDELPQVAYYRDRPIEDLSREELIEAVRHLGGQLFQQFRYARQTAQMHEALSEARRKREVGSGIS